MPRTSLQEGVPFDSRTVCSHRVYMSILAIPLAYEMTSVRLEINMAYTDLQSLGYRENSLTAPVIPTPSSVSSTCYKQESLFDAIAIISSLSRQMLFAVTFLSMFTAVDTFPESLSAEAENGKTNQYFLLRSVTKKRNLLTQSHLVKTCKLVVLVDDIGHRGHYGRIDETEDENDTWPKVTENQTNHIVVTLS